MRADLGVGEVGPRAGELHAVAAVAGDVAPGFDHPSNRGPMPVQTFARRVRQRRRAGRGVNQADEYGCRGVWWAWGVGGVKHRRRPAVTARGEVNKEEKYVCGG